MPIAKVVAQYRNPQTLQELEAGIDVSASGRDEVDGIAAKVYSYTLTAPRRCQVKAWVADGSGQLLQVESTGSFLGIKSTTRVRYSDIDDPLIEIGEPL